MRPVAIRLVMILGILFTPQTVRADVQKNWSVDYSNSHLNFVGTQGSSSSFEGSFRSFKVTLRFDPAHPEQGQINAVINTGSATSGDDERDVYLPQNDWFNIAAFPEAQFISDTILKTGENQFVAQGSLTIKGISHTVKLPFTLKPEADHWRAHGELTLNRTDFNIGQGEWINENYVKHAVQVVVDLSVKP